MSHGLAGSVLRHQLSGVSGAFARAFETDATGAGPANDMALHVGDAHERIIESGGNKIVKQFKCSEIPRLPVVDCSLIPAAKPGSSLQIGK